MKLLIALISTLASTTLFPVKKLPSLDFYLQLVMDHGASGFDTMAYYRVSVDGHKVKGDSAFDSESLSQRSADMDKSLDMSLCPSPCPKGKALLSTSDTD